MSDDMQAKEFDAQTIEMLHMINFITNVRSGKEKPFNAKAIKDWHVANQDSISNSIKAGMAGDDDLKM